MNKLKSIKLKVFPHIVYIGYNISKEEFREESCKITSEHDMSGRGLPDDLFTCSGFCTMSGKNIFIYIKPKNKKKEIISTLNHEVCHACFYILKDLDTPINSDTEEIYCYLNQYLNDKITKIIFN